MILLFFIIIIIIIFFWGGGGWETRFIMVYVKMVNSQNSPIVQFDTTPNLVPKAIPSSHFS